MTTERFMVDDAGTLIDMQTRDTFDYVSDVCGLLNELHEENIELRFQLNLCSDQRNEFHRGARENANRVGKLKKENEQLKSDVLYWRTLAQNLAKGNKIGEFEMMDKEVTVDLNELDINIQKEIIFKSDLNKWIESKMSYYQRMMEKTDGSNYVNAKGHLDMLIMLKEWLEQRK